MKHALWIAVALILLPGAASRAEMPDSDRRAITIANRVMEALGGRARWEALRGLRWSFEVVIDDTMRSSRRHAWDKRTNWHRVEGTNRQGVPFVMVDQIETGRGMAWMNATPMEGDTVAKLTRRAKSLWTNDTYWMLMPFKLRDPGVHLMDAGDTTIAGTTFDRLALHFENVGETPRDRYWVYVNRANHRVERWDYILQDQPPPPQTWTWEGWEQHGGLWFPTVHRNGTTVIYTRRIETVNQFPPGTFRRP